MKIILVKDLNDSIGDCENILNELKDKMESDYPEINSYEVKYDED